MPDDKASRETKPEREPFITIDDLLHQAQELFDGLVRLSTYRHPLEVRRGLGKEVKQSMQSNKQSKQIKGSGRTYFFDVEETKEGKPYLRITESRKGDGDTFERSSVHVFPEDATEFAQSVSEMTSKIDQE